MWRIMIVLVCLETGEVIALFDTVADLIKAVDSGGITFSPVHK